MICEKIYTVDTRTMQHPLSV